MAIFAGTLFMKRQQIILLAAAIGLITGFFFLPMNRTWLNEKLVPYWSDFKKQKKKLEPEERKIARYGASYTYSKHIAAFFKKRANKNDALVLLPSTKYFENNGIKYNVPEPAVFYYYTGLKTTWANSKKAPEANWLVRVEKNKIIIDSITNAEVLRDTIAAYQKYSYPL